MLRLQVHSPDEHALLVRSHALLGSTKVREAILYVSTYTLVVAVCVHLSDLQHRQAIHSRWCGGLKSPEDWALNDESARAW